MTEVETGLRACPTCAGESVRVSGEFEGYIEGYRTFVLECSRCTLRFSSRSDVPDGLYDQIYTHAATLPGYDRYCAYASAVTRHPSPLDLLASAELPYWFVRDHVQNRLAPGATVIDLGCGEGYLTYALRRAGIRCFGLDLSATAVRKARERFGHDDWFLVVGELADSGFAGADLVVALELVEHVPEPKLLLDNALSMLKAGGNVLMTTPNRDASPADLVWDSDLPPVHLQWFGRDALVELGAQSDCDVDFPAAPEAGTGSDDGVRSGSWPPLLTATGEPTPVIIRQRSVPWRARMRLGRSLRRFSHVLERPPYRQIPRVEAVRRPATLGVTFTPRSETPRSERRLNGTVR